MTQSSNLIHFMKWVERLLKEKWVEFQPADQNLQTKIPQIIYDYESHATGFETKYPRVISLRPVSERSNPHTCGASVSDVTYRCDVDMSMYFYTNLDEADFDLTANNIVAILGRYLRSGGYFNIDLKSGKFIPSAHKYVMRWDLQGSIIT